MHRSSPPRRVPDLAITAATEVGDPSEATFVNLFASHVQHEGGFARPVYGILPDMPEYDRLRFSFGVPTLAGTDPDATIQLWGKGSEDAPFLLGESALSAAGTFPAIEVDNHQGTFAIIVGGISGTGAELSVDVFVQGLFETVAVVG